MFAVFPQDGPVTILIFDAVQREGHDASSIITRNAVEKGAPITDHIQDEPEVLNVDGVISNTPLYPSGLKQRGFKAPLLLDVAKDPPQLDISLGGAISFLTGLVAELFSGPAAPPIAGDVLQFATPFDAILETQADLDAIRTAKVLCIVTTMSKTYTDMVLERYTQTRDAFGHAVFSLSFRRVFIVSSSLVQAPLPKEPRGAPAVSAGAAAGVISPSSAPGTANVSTGNIAGIREAAARGMLPILIPPGGSSLPGGIVP